MRAGAEDAAFEKHRHNAQPTAVRKVRRTMTYTSEAKRAASLANLKNTTRTNVLLASLAQKNQQRPAVLLAFPV